MTTTQGNGSTKHIQKQHVRRAYWEIVLVKQDSNDLNGNDHTVTVRGRRRTSEPFWPGLQLDLGTLLRFSVSIRNAVTVAQGFAADDCSYHASFPNSQILAICHGTDYVLETSETIDGWGNRSITTTIFTTEQPILPAVYLIDEELIMFCDDLEQVAGQLIADSENHNSSTFPTAKIP